jgi:hypothetical protein
MNKQVKYGILYKIIDYLGCEVKFMRFCDKKWIGFEDFQRKNKQKLFEI